MSNGEIKKFRDTDWGAFRRSLTTHLEKFTPALQQVLDDFPGELKFKVVDVDWIGETAYVQLALKTVNENKDAKREGALVSRARRQNLDLNKTVGGFRLSGYDATLKRPYILRRVADNAQFASPPETVERMFRKSKDR